MAREHVCELVTFLFDVMMGDSLFGNAYTVYNLVHWGLITINIMV